MSLSNHENIDFDNAGKVKIMLSDRIGGKRDILAVWLGRGEIGNDLAGRSVLSEGAVVGGFDTFEGQ